MHLDDAYKSSFVNFDAILVIFIVTNVLPILIIPIFEVMIICLLVLFFIGAYPTILLRLVHAIFELLLLVVLQGLLLIEELPLVLMPVRAPTSLLRVVS